MDNQQGPLDKFSRHVDVILNFGVAEDPSYIHGVKLQRHGSSYT
jgi:hypothetical protein